MCIKFGRCAVCAFEALAIVSNQFVLGWSLQVYVGVFFSQSGMSKLSPRAMAFVPGFFTLISLQL